MAEVPSTHYVKSDDVYIACQVLGEGPLDLIFMPGFVSNIEAMWPSPNRSRFFRRLASCDIVKHIFPPRVLPATRIIGRRGRDAHPCCAGRPAGVCLLHAG